MKKKFIVHFDEFTEPMKNRIIFSKDSIYLEQGDLSDAEFEREKQIFADFLKSQAEKYNTDDNSDKETKPHMKNVKITRAKTFYSPKDKPTRAIFGLLEDFDNSIFFNQQNQEENGVVRLPVGKTKKGEEVKTSIQINIDELLKNDNITLSRELTPFDRAVHDAVISLIVAKNDCFYDNELFRTIAGYSRYDDRPAPPTIKKAIQESLKKMSLIRVRVNATQEAEKMNYPGLKQLKRAIFENYLLPLKEVEIEFSNGETVEGYRLLDTPPLYACAGAKKHMLGCDMQHLKLPETIEATPQAIVIRNYLLEQIEIMKKSEKKNSGIHRNSNIIFDTLYKVLDVQGDKKDNDSIVKKRKWQARSTVEELLKAWKESGYILGHESILEGRKITGVAILLS